MDKQDDSQSSAPAPTQEPAATQPVSEGYRYWLVGTSDCLVAVLQVNHYVNSNHLHRAANKDLPNQHKKWLQRYDPNAEFIVLPGSKFYQTTTGCYVPLQCAMQMAQAFQIPDIYYELEDIARGVPPTISYPMPLIFLPTLESRPQSSLPPLSARPLLSANSASPPPLETARLPPSNIMPLPLRVTPSLPPSVAESLPTPNPAKLPQIRPRAKTPPFPIVVIPKGHAPVHRHYGPQPEKWLYISGSQSYADVHAHQPASP